MAPLIPSFIPSILLPLWPGGPSALEHAALVAAGLLAYVVVTRVRRDRRAPSAAMGWVLAIVVYPYLAVPLFLLVGSRKSRHIVQPLPAVGGDAPSPVEPAGTAPQWALQTLRAVGVAPPVANRCAQVLEDGPQALRALLELCGQARATLDVGTFVYGTDAVGDEVARALVQAAARGVRTRLMVDAIGSLHTTPRRLSVLEDGGVQVLRFAPMLHKPLRGNSNLRNHRKVAVADGRHLWSGGRNIACEYFLPTAGEPPWVDLSYVVDGPLAAIAQAHFEQDWRRGSGRRVTELPAVAAGGLAIAAAPPAAPFDAAVAGAPSGSISAARSGAGSEAVVLSPARLPALAATAAAAASEAEHGAATRAIPLPATPLWCQWIATGPDCQDDTLHALLMSAAYHARRSIRAVTPYFVPDDALVRAWTLAARRGVEVTLVVPARSNHRLADIARERLLRELVQAGAHVRLLPQMVHAKAVVVDDALALCGSLNLDERSLFLNYECMTAFYDAAPIAALAGFVDRLSARSTAHDGREPGWARDLLEGAVRSMAYQL